MRSHRTQRGVSLIETVLYLALFSVVSVAVFEGITASIRTFSTLRAERDINDTGVRSIERITRDIQNATSIDYGNSTFGANPGRLTLNVQTGSSTTSVIEYSVTGGQLHIEENGVDLGTLTTSRATVESLIFRAVQFGQVRGVKIELWIEATYGSVTRSEHFYNSAVVRGTY